MLLPTCQRQTAALYTALALAGKSWPRVLSPETGLPLPRASVPPPPRADTPDGPPAPDYGTNAHANCVCAPTVGHGGG